jgi:hypothetical protein
MGFAGYVRSDADDDKAMINIDHVRVSFRNYRGTPESAQRIAKLTMERLSDLVAETKIKHTSRVVDRIACEPRVSSQLNGDEAMAEFLAGHAWQTILGHI